MVRQSSGAGEDSEDMPSLIHTRGELGIGDRSENFEGSYQPCMATAAAAPKKTNVATEDKDAVMKAVAESQSQGRR